MMESKHIQPMDFGEMVKYSFQNGKAIFLRSLLGNFVLLSIFSTLLIILYDYSASVGANDMTLRVLSMFNNMVLLIITSANVFYLLLEKRNTPYMRHSFEAFKKTSWIVITLIAATFIYAVFVMIGMALLIVPGILVFTYFAIYSQSIAFEKKGPVSSLLRSRELVGGSFWKVFPMVLGILVITNIALFLVSFMLRSLLPVYNIFAEIGSILFSYMIIMPFLASFYILLYFDLRSRQEAFDYTKFEMAKQRLMENDTQTEQ